MASAYSPVLTGDDGRVSVQLADDHPGVSDPAYRARRDSLASLAASWSPGEPIPEPAYTESEHDTWCVVAAELARMHRRHATRRFQAGAARLGLPIARIPQLSDVTRKLEPLTGFRYMPVAGLAPLRQFYGDFAAGTFWSTQYLRHPSAPLYTPEPDLVHEVIGHANQLADREVADLYRLVGQAVARVETPEALRALSQVFWFTVEFGVVTEDGDPKAFGAGLLSSVAELDAYRSATIVPADLAAMAGADYDITRFQPVLHSWRSEGHLLDTLGDLFARFDDDVAGELLATATA